ncbi:MAG: hypothetical protein KA123_02420 [Candidatus Eisenbacteria bacterium]|nr:hypothetical protein [Candidatus Eisenbacteria bacterium]
MSACNGHSPTDLAGSVRTGLRALASFVCACLAVVLLLSARGENSPAAAQSDLSTSLAASPSPSSAELLARRQWTSRGAPLVPIALDIDPAGGIWGIEGAGHRLFREDERAPGGVRMAGGGEGPGRLSFVTRLFARTGLKVFTLDPFEAILDRYDFSGVQEERIDLEAQLQEAGEDLGEASDFCLDPAGDLHLLDASRERILQFDGAAQFRESLGESEGLDLRGPIAIDVDGRGRLFVLTTRPAGVGRMEPGRTFTWSALPSLTEQPLKPSSLAVDSWGNLFVGMQEAGGVLVLPVGAEPWLLVPPEGRMHCADLAWERGGRLYVADAPGAQVWVFSLHYGPRDGASGPSLPGG